MKGKDIKANHLILFFLFIVISLAGCGDKEINSKWRTNDITIDGNDSDWSGSLVFYDDINSLVGVQNDNDYLYLCLVTTDQQLERKVLISGITLWFDNTGGGEKKFGIRFPIMRKNMDKKAFMTGDNLGEGRRRDPDDGRESRGDDTQQQGLPDPNRMGDAMLKNQTEIEVVDSRHEATRFPISELRGIQLKMTVKDYRMVYEFKIPIFMKSGFSYAIGARPNSKISVAFESGRPEVRKNIYRREKSDGEGSTETPTGEGTDQGTGGDDMGGSMYGGRGGHGRRGQQGNGFNRVGMDLQTFWTAIQLSSGGIDFF